MTFENLAIHRVILDARLGALAQNTNEQTVHRIVPSASGVCIFNKFMVGGACEQEFNIAPQTGLRNKRRFFFQNSTTRVEVSNQNGLELTKSLTPNFVVYGNLTHPSTGIKFKDHKLLYVREKEKATQGEVSFHGGTKITAQSDFQNLNLNPSLKISGALKTHIVSQKLQLPVANLGLRGDLTLSPHTLVPELKLVFETAVGDFSYNGRFFHYSLNMDKKVIMLHAKKSYEQNVASTLNYAGDSGLSANCAVETNYSQKLFKPFPDLHKKKLLKVLDGQTQKQKPLVASLPTAHITSHVNKCMNHNLSFFRKKHFYGHQKVSIGINSYSKKNLDGFFPVSFYNQFFSLAPPILLLFVSSIFVQSLSCINSKPKKMKNYEGFRLFSCVYSSDCFSTSFLFESTDTD